MTSIDERAAIDLVMRLIAIAGGSGAEHDVAAFITERLQTAGVPKSAIRFDRAGRRSSLQGSTGNMIVRLPGTQRGPRRLLMAHMDTVPLCVGARPVRRGSMIESRDAVTALGGDNRAGCAVVLNTICDVLQHDLPHPPLTLLWTVQEEVGLLGVRHLDHRRLGSPTLCFNWDGGAPNQGTIGATGAVNMDITVHGIASHAGAHPELGVSATEVAGVAIAELSREGWLGLVTKGRQSGTSNIGVISGGTATNVVTPTLTLRAEARSHSTAFRQRIVSNYRRAFERAVRQVRDCTGRTGSLEFEADPRYDSFRLSRREPCVRAAAAAMRALDLEPDLRICNGGLDANWLTAHGYPTVTLGCGQQAIHTVDEVLHVESYLNACRIARPAGDCGRVMSHQQPPHAYRRYSRPWSGTGEPSAIVGAVSIR